MKNFLLRYCSVNMNSFDFKTLSCVISIREILVAILHLVLIFYVIDRRLPLSFRIADILLLSIFMCLLFSKTPLFFDRKIVQPNLFWWLFFFLGSVFGILKFGFNFNYAILYYKYFLIFCIPIIYLTLVNSQKIFNTQMKLWCFSFWVLVLWPFLRTYLVLTGQFGASLRIDFPFSVMISGYHSYGGHLYSALIGFGMIYLFLRKRLIKRENPSLIDFGLLFLMIIVLTLCGSRGGVLGLIIIGGALMLNYFKLLVSKMLLKRLFLMLLISLPVVIWKMKNVFAYYDAQNKLFSYFIMRAFDFNFFHDASSITRVKKLLQSIEYIQSNGFLIGNGPFIPQFWFDGFLANLLSSSGLLGALLFFIVVYNFVKRARYYAKKNKRCKEYLIFKYLIYYYAFVNIVATEFILVTRSAVPCLSLLMLLYIAIKRDYDLIPLNKTV